MRLQRAGERSVEQGEPGPGGKQRLALPCPSAARAQAWIDADSEKAWCSAVFVALRFVRRESVGATQARVPARLERGRRAGEIGSNHLGMMDRWRRFVTPRGAESAPLVVEWAMSDNLTLSDMIRKPAQTPCQTPQNQALSPSSDRPEAAPEARL